MSPARKKKLTTGLGPGSWFPAQSEIPAALSVARYLPSGSSVPNTHSAVWVAGFQETVNAGTAPPERLTIARSPFWREADTSSENLTETARREAALNPADAVGAKLGLPG